MVADFMDWYTEAMVFADFGDTENGQPSDDAEFSPEAFAAIRKVAEDFLERFEKRIEHLHWMEIRPIGHDLWYSRNGHGTGFWDRFDEYERSGLPKELVQEMDEYAKALGECHPYVGDDGLVYLFRG